MELLSIVNTRKVGIPICIGIILVSAFLAVFRLGTEPFIDYDEAIYAQVVHDTVAAGDLLTMHQGDSTWFDKPPLYFWEARSWAAILGETELAYRLPAALAFVASVGLVMLIASAVSADYVVAILAGLILLTMGSYLEASRQLRLDVPTTAASLLALFCFIKGRSDSRWYLGTGIGIALGVMTKSVIGLAYGPVFIIWSLVYREWSWLKDKYVWAASALGLALLAPWHLYESINYGGQFWYGYFFHNVVDHVTTNVNGGDASVFDYLSVLFQYNEPWMALFVLSAIWVAINHKRLSREIVVFYLSATVLLIVFSIAQTKTSYYLISAYPLIALSLAFVGRYTLKWLAATRMKTAFIVGTFLIVGALVSTVFVGFHLVYPDFVIIDGIKSEEAQIGKLMKEKNSPMDVYTFDYSYWDTIHYYSGGKNVHMLVPDQVLPTSMFLVILNEVVANVNFPDEFSRRLKVDYKGQYLTLFEFDQSQ
jgi:4-amino-4-deoxy-L-arabinose transferase-like glycosyltransferase